MFKPFLIRQKRRAIRPCLTAAEPHTTHSAKALPGLQLPIFAGILSMPNSGPITLAGKLSLAALYLAAFSQ